jgi:hypothetical protein
MKSLIFYRPAIRRAIFKQLDYDQKVQFYNKVREEDELRKRIFGTGIVDRKGEINFGIRTTNVDPIPPNEESNVGELHDLLLTKAKELCDTGRIIDAFWSGGIDSTSTVCLLREYAQPSQLRIILTQGSIEENPRFYDKYVKHLPHIINPDKNVRSEITEENITVFANEPDTLYSAGSPGDSALGQGQVGWSFYNKIRFGWSWRRYRNYEGYVHDVVNIDNCESLFIGYDVQRWFITKHLQRHLALEHSHGANSWSRAEHSTENGKLLNVGDDYNDYLDSKMELRDIIAYYTGDKEYAYKKDKVISLRHGQADAWGDICRNVAVCADGTIIRRDQVNDIKWEDFVTL